MKEGCHCKWCMECRNGGGTNGDIVRNALLSLSKYLRRHFPHLNLTVNASAPGLNQDHWTGGHLLHLAGIFDEYVTEWNPYRWGQPAEFIAPMLRKARSLTNGTLSHASTVTTRHGTLLSETQLSDLFKAILREGATPWLSVYLNRTALNQVYEAYCRAQLSLS